MMGVRGPNIITCYDNARCNLVADLHVTSSNSICSGHICIISYEYSTGVEEEEEARAKTKTVLATHILLLYKYIIYI